MALPVFQVGDHLDRLLTPEQMAQLAVAAYTTWDRLGRPLEPAQPIREMVEGLRVAFPRANTAKIFSWYANEAHYQASVPQDHTPFSVTGWPAASPRWVVFATDVMHRPHLGVDCDVLFLYWMQEAKAGRMPWLKYLIWQARLYDVRNDWRPQANSGHFDHIHLSGRTDHRYTHLGNWNITPGGDMADLASNEWADTHFPSLPNDASIDQRVWAGQINAAVRDLQKKVAALLVSPPSGMTVAQVTQIAQEVVSATKLVPTE